MSTNSALKEIEVANWEKEQREEAISLLKKVKANPIEKRKKPILVCKKPRTVIYRLTK